MVLLSSFVVASINCPCSYEGPEGTIVGFTARNGSTDNVTLYTETTPTLKGEMVMWALKNIEYLQVPITGLEVSIMHDSEEIETFVSDENGWFAFNVDEHGSYEVIGGDAVYAFEIAAPEPVVVGCPEDARLCDDGSSVVRIPPECEFEECPEGPQDMGGSQPTAEEAEKALQNITYDSTPMMDNVQGPFNPLDPVPLTIIIVVVAIIALVILKKK